MKKSLLYLAIIAIFTFNTHAQINVTATAGTATGAYTTLKSAFDAVNDGTHQGAITISVTENTTETAMAALNASEGTASYTSVLIKPATGVNATITAANAMAAIKLNGADNVTIDGSNNGSSSRNLSITNTFVAVTNTTPAVVWLSSTATAGAENVTIKNTNIAGGTSAGTIAGIITSGTTQTLAAEAPNNNFSAINNTFMRSQNAIFISGNVANTDTGFVIKNNEIGSTIATDKMLFRGIAIQYAKNFEISGNVINGVALPATSTNYCQAIFIGASTTNGVIFNNVISDIKQPNTGGYGAVGILLNSNSTAANMLVYNNIISDIAGHGYANLGGIADNANGIAVNQGAGYKIYHNTVVMNTNQVVAGRPAAFNVTQLVTAPGAIDLRNNIFVNTQTQAGEKYVIYSGAPNTVFSNINNNNYYTTGSNLGYIGTAAKATLADIQTAFGGNTNSLNVLPAFVSGTDFHLAATAANTALDNKATPLAEVTTDADGVTRNALTPDLGSFEFSAPASAESFGKSKVSYNNPVADYLQIRLDNEISNVEIYNISGQRVSNVNINAAQGAVDMRALPAGVYLAKVNAQNGSETIKILKK